jgi:hypothetical protein
VNKTDKGPYLHGVCIVVEGEQRPQPIIIRKKMIHLDTPIIPALGRPRQKD